MSSTPPPTPPRPAPGRRAYLAIGALGVALFLPSLGAGFFSDDQAHLLVLEGKMDRAYPATPLDLFRFVSGDPGQTAEIVRLGYLQWWTDLRLKLSFLRPLTALTHVLDHALWGRFAKGYHLTNLVLWALLLWTAAGLLRRVAPTPRAAMLAFLVYAVSDAHALVVTWIANRNALLATALGFGGLWAWDVFRRDGRRGAAALAYIAFGLALLAGEAALGGVALLLAYEALGLPAGARWSLRRLLPAAPFLLLALGYVLAYKLGGYGAGHSALYIDPSSQPLKWLAAAATRFPLLLAGVIWSWPIDPWVLGGGVRRVLEVGALLLLPVTAAVFWRPIRQSRTLAAFALGGALAILPSVSTFPSPRLLLLAGLPGALLVGSYLDAAWPLRSAGRWRRLVAGFFWLRNVALAPVMLLLSVLVISSMFRQNRQEVLDSPWPEDVAGREVVLLNAPHWASASYIGPILSLAGRPAPRAVHALNLSPFPAEVSRTTSSSLVFRLECGEMLTTTFEQVTRDEPIPAGASFDAGLFRATVLETGAIGPKAVRFDFSRSLEEGIQLMRWGDGRYEPVPLPRVGDSLRLGPLSIGLGKLRSPAPTCGREP